MYIDICIVRRDCVFQNFRIFPFLEKGIFSLCSSGTDAHFFVFVTQKRYGNVTFSDYRNVGKSPKMSSFRIFSRIFTMRKDRILCSDNKLKIKIVKNKTSFDKSYLYLFVTHLFVPLLVIF